jgi:phosphoserine phosphatase
MLPSWRPGSSRESVVRFLESSTEIPPEQRLAVFDNDGTLWCEKPEFTQMLFYLDQLRAAVSEQPDLGSRAEYAALLEGDRSAIATMGLERLALALVELFEGREPAFFEQRVREWFESTVHPDRRTPYEHMVYQPMLELIDELRSRDFTVCIVTGGGTEFVRAVSQDLYGVAPERVVGTLVGYEMRRRDAGEPYLVRVATTVLDANEGAAKVSNIQTALGRRPIVAGGNSAGDREMLEYAAAADGPSLALLIDHDDAEREYAYESKAGTFEAAEPITDTGRRLGWTVVSMADDWSRVYPE